MKKSVSCYWPKSFQFFTIQKKILAIPWRSSGQDSALSLPTAWVQSLVRELRFRKLRGPAKNKRKKNAAINILLDEYLHTYVNASLVYNPGRTNGSKCKKDFQDFDSYCQTEQQNIFTPYNICTSTFITAFIIFTITMTWKQPMCLLMNEQKCGTHINDEILFSHKRNPAICNNMDGP